MRTKRTKGLLPLKIYLPHSAHHPFPNAQSEEMKEDVLFPRRSMCTYMLLNAEYSVEKKVSSSSGFPKTRNTPRPCIENRQKRNLVDGWRRALERPIPRFPASQFSTEIPDFILLRWRSSETQLSPSRNLQQGRSLVTSYDPPFSLHHSSAENKRRKEEG